VAAFADLERNARRDRSRGAEHRRTCHSRAEIHSYAGAQGCKALLKFSAVRGHLEGDRSGIRNSAAAIHGGPVYTAFPRRFDPPPLCDRTRQPGVKLAVSNDTVRLSFPLIHFTAPISAPIRMRDTWAALGSTLAAMPWMFADSLAGRAYRLCA